MSEQQEIERELLVEEYKSCRELIGKNIEIMEKSEFYVVGAIAAIAVFSINAKTASVANPSALLPIAISLFGFVRYKALDKTIWIINEYFQEIESKYPKIKWTTVYREKNTRDLKHSRDILWCSLIGFSVVFFIFVCAFGPLNKEIITNCAKRLAE